MSYIYVIGTENQVKIGFSKTPEKRLKQIFGLVVLYISLKMLGVVP